MTTISEMAVRLRSTRSHLSCRGDHTLLARSVARGRAGILSVPVASHFWALAWLNVSFPTAPANSELGPKAYATQSGTRAVDGGNRCDDHQRAARIGFRAWLFLFIFTTIGTD